MGKKISEFDKCISRIDTGSLKYDKYKGRDVIPMWVADMDFRSPEPVRDALRKRINHGIFGYSSVPGELIGVIVDKLKRDYGWIVSPRSIVPLPSVVVGLNLACRCTGSDGDEAIVFTPVYPPFLEAPPHSRRTLVMVPLACRNNFYTIDAQAFENAITKKTKTLLLCNPHNPVGRMFGKKELKAVAGVCLKNNITICSDEIHCELVLAGKKHIPIAAMSKEIEDITITLISAGKTFNLPGLNCGFAIIPNEKLRRAFKTAKVGIVEPFVNLFGLTASLAAYRDCEPWKKDLLIYLKKNKDILHKAVNTQMKPLSMGDVEATYLAWIDARKLNVADPVKFFEEAGVGLGDGSEFGLPGFVRLTFGCPRKVLLEALDRMRKAVNEHLVESV
jgi:cystathionine beta-lyase